MKNNGAVIIPADVPNNYHQEFTQNYLAITHNTGKLALFACDQKIEHLNNDFYGASIDPDALHPEHLFAIAHQGAMGAMAAHLGLIARYGSLYPTINFIAKLNGKTDLNTTKDPLSKQLWNVQDVITLKKNSGLAIRGIGLTIYIGSEFESSMLEQAAQTIFHAHQYGLITIVWIYARGASIKNDKQPELLAGATGLANALGADFVKIKAPEPANALRIATVAAGNTKVICSGGEKKSPELFLQELYDQIHVGGACGSATGRNIFQHALPQAIALTRAIQAIVYQNHDVEKALQIYREIKPV